MALGEQGSKWLLAAESGSPLIAGLAEA